MKCVSGSVEVSGDAVRVRTVSGKVRIDTNVDGVRSRPCPGRSRCGCRRGSTQRCTPTVTAAWRSACRRGATERSPCGPSAGRCGCDRGDDHRRGARARRVGRGRVHRHRGVHRVLRTPWATRRQSRSSVEGTLVARGSAGGSHREGAGRRLAALVPDRRGVADETCLDLQDSFERDRRGPPPCLSGCGWVCTGGSTRRGDDLVGHDINVTARIVDVAGPGEVLVSEATHAALVGREREVTSTSWARW